MSVESAKDCQSPRHYRTPEHFDLHILPKFVVQTDFQGENVSLTQELK